MSNSETPLFRMPLLDAAQAQKHITVNEALARVDALAAGRVLTFGAATAPESPNHGDAHIVGDDATGAWLEQDSTVALYLNGGWVFVAPWMGLSLWVEADNGPVRFEGETWVADAVAVSPGGAATAMRVIEFDHVLDTATTSTTPNVIPDKAIVYGVTARVIEAITGPDSWEVGVPGSQGRYGSGFGKQAGSMARGVTGQPQAYFGDTPLEITAVGGSFSAGTIRIAIHLLEIRPPRSA